MRKFMVKFVISTCVVLICIALLNMCGAENEAKRLLKDKGYKIVSSFGRVEYTLTKDWLNKTPNQGVWGLQKVKANDYIGKKIETYGFVVKNHPLDNKSYSDRKQTKVVIMVCEGKVIGGFSFPYSEELLTGGEVYPLEGNWGIN